MKALGKRIRKADSATALLQQLRGDRRAIFKEADETRAAMSAAAAAAAANAAAAAAAADDDDADPPRLMWADADADDERRAPEAAAHDALRDHHASKFVIGDVVHVAARTRKIGRNAEGGAARVIAVKDDGTYDVKYVDENRHEYGLDPILLVRALELEHKRERRERSVPGAAVADPSADEIRQLRRARAQVESVARSREWEASEANKRARGATDALRTAREAAAMARAANLPLHEALGAARAREETTASTSSAAAASAAEQARAEAERVAARALATAGKKHKAALRETQHVARVALRASDEEARVAMRAVEAEVAASSQLAANESRRAEEASRRAEALEVENAKLTASLGGHSLDGIARAALTAEDYESFSGKDRSINALGASATSVAAMGGRRRRDLVSITTKIIVAVLDRAKAGAADRDGVLRAVTRSRAFAPLLRAATGVEPTARNAGSLAHTCADSFIIARKHGHKRTALQFLSLLVVQPGMTEAAVMQLCSEAANAAPLSAGEHVLVLTAKGNNWHHGAVATASAADAAQIDIMPFAGSHSGRIAPAGKYRREHVRPPDAVRCSPYLIHEAKVHAALTYPGAVVDTTTYTLERMAPEQISYITRFLRRPDVIAFPEASLAGARSGVEFLLKDTPAALYRRLRCEMIESRLEPCSHRYFEMLCADKKYGRLTAANCCCRSCRDLGINSYEELLAVLDEVQVYIDAGFFTELKRAIEDEARFRRGSFRRHLKSQDGDARHCMRELCTAANVAAFRKPCDHPRSDGTRGTAPATRAMTAALNRAVPPHVRDCMVCAAATTGHSGTTVKCDTCCNVAHRVCVIADHYDLDDDKQAAWRCTTCVVAADAATHDTSCDECSRSSYILDDLRRIVDSLSPR